MYSIELNTWMRCRDLNKIKPAVKTPKNEKIVGKQQTLGQIKTKQLLTEQATFADRELDIRDNGGVDQECKFFHSL